MATPEQPARAARVLDDLYRRHAAEVFRYTYAVLGNRADAEDVTQATFVNALRALERGEQPRKAANWLLAIAHNLMRQRFRQERARPTQVLLDSDLPQAALTDDDDAPSVGELVRALGRIPVSQREAIVMREFEGRSYTEIAQILGVTTSALETLLFRARRSLAEELENLVTCARAEQDVSRLLDGRLSRRERKRLQEHVESCPACARFEAFQRKQRRALKGLAVLPLPASLMLFKGVHGASAASLPTIGAGTTAAAAGGAASGGVTFGGLALGGIATKAAVVLAAVAAAGGVSYEGAAHLHTGTQHPTPEQGASNAKPSAHANAAARKAIAVARARQAAKAHHLSGIRAAKPKAAAQRHSSAKSQGAGVKSGKAAGHVTTPKTGGTSSSHRSAGSTTKTASVQAHQSRPAKSTTTDKQKATTTQPTTPPAGGSAGGTPPNGTESASSNGKTGTATGSPSTDTSTSTPQGGGSANGVTGGAGGGAAKGHGK